MTSDHDELDAGTVAALRDGAALDVLRTAYGLGYVLTGPHNRVCRRDPDSYHNAVDDISRHERDTVQALAVAGLLELGHRETVLDRDGTTQFARVGYPFVLTHHGRNALHTTWGTR